MTTPIKPPPGTGGAPGASSTEPAVVTPNHGLAAGGRAFRAELATTPDGPSGRATLPTTATTATTASTPATPTVPATAGTRGDTSAVSGTSLPDSVAEAIRSGRLAPAEAIDSLVRHTMDSPLAAALAPDAKRRLEASLRAQLVDDPALASLVADLGRAPTR